MTDTKQKIRDLQQEIDKLINEDAYFAAGKYKIPNDERFPSGVGEITDARQVDSDGELLVQSSTGNQWYVFWDQLQEIKVITALPDDGKIYKSKIGYHLKTGKGTELFSCEPKIGWVDTSVVWDNCGYEFEALNG